MVGEEKFVTSLPTLSKRKQLAFALLIFERMLPSLIAFSKNTGFDNSCYLQARDAAWGSLQNGENDTLYASLNEACLRNAPDTEAFSHELTSYTLNATLVISEIMEFELDSRSDHVAYVSTLARDSVHLYLSSLDPSVLSPPEEDAGAAAHPLMQEEMRRQEEDITFLSHLPDQFGAQTISALLARASTQASLLPLAR